MVLITQLISIDLEQARQKLFIHRRRRGNVLRAVRVGHSVVISIVADERCAKRIQLEIFLKVTRKQRVQQGVTQPRILMEKLLPQINAHIVDDPTDSNFYGPITNLPEDFSEEERVRLTAAYEDKILNTIIPAYQRISNFIGDEYLGVARDTVGLYGQPNGADWYSYMVRIRTTTDMTPDEIHQIGLDEVARIHGEMRGVISVVARMTIR